MIDWTRLGALHDGHDTGLAAYVEDGIDCLEEGLMRLPFAAPDAVGALLDRLGAAASDLGMNRLASQLHAAADDAGDVDMTALITAYAASKQMLMRDLHRLIDGESAQDVA